MPKLVELKREAAPPGQVLSGESMGFTDACAVCGKQAKMFGFAFSEGEEVEALGAKIRNFAIPECLVCGIECFKQTRSYQAIMSGKPTCRVCRHLEHEVGDCGQGCGCGSYIKKQQMEKAL